MERYVHIHFTFVTFFLSTSFTSHAFPVSNDWDFLSEFQNSFSFNAGAGFVVFWDFLDFKSRMI